MRGDRAELRQFVSRRKKERALQDLYVFVREVLGYEDVAEQPHREMVGFLTQAVQELGKDQQRQSMLLVPRGCFKTTIGSVALPLWLLAHYPNLRILITSHTHEYSKQILDEVKWHCVNNAVFRELFGSWDVGSDQWSDDAIVIAPRTVALKEPSIDTAGVDRSKTGGHYDLIIADDLHSERNIDTDGLRRKVRRHLQTLRPILEPGGVILIIGTRWHNDDAYGGIIRREAERRDNNHATEWDILVRSAELPDGDLYFPARLTRRFLESQKANLESKFYSVWYDNKPLEEGSIIFPKAWWKFWQGDFYSIPTAVIKRADGEVVPLFITMALDPAISGAAHSDYSGITVVGTSPSNDWYVLDARRVRGGPAVLLPELAYCIRTYHPHILSIETVGFQEMLKMWVLDRLSQMGLKVGIHEYKESTRRGKGARIEALQPRFKQGRIFLKSGLRDLYSELEDYPETTHDDLLDSLAQHSAVSRPARAKDLETYDDDPWSMLNRRKEREKEEREAGQVVGGWAGRATTHL